MFAVRSAREERSLAAKKQFLCALTGRASAVRDDNAKPKIRAEVRHYDRKTKCKERFEGALRMALLDIVNARTKTGASIGWFRTATGSGSPMEPK